MLNSIHFLLTYQCTFECDHCFLYCGPFSDGVFTLENMEFALMQIKEIRSIDSVYFEGGEPFMYYPLMLQSIKLAREMGLRVGIVSNSYWATSVKDAELWLRPLKELGIEDISISNDLYHFDSKKTNLAEIAFKAAKSLDITCSYISIDDAPINIETRKDKDGALIGGKPLFKGRAVDKLAKDYPRQAASKFIECPEEDLIKPGRVHLDPFGNIHICQGLVIGNIYKFPLKEIFEKYKPESDPIVGLLIKGGPYKLAKEFNFDTSSGFVDACHLCYEVRKSLIAKFPDMLTPPQVYGVV